MSFYRYEPPDVLRMLIECYWIIEDDNPVTVQQKIIPDGFPEIIFHYRDPYRIKLDNNWELQPKSLLAGQLTKFFYLENTGRSGVLGIKFKPTAITHLFNISMGELTDKVVALDSQIVSLDTMETEMRKCTTHERMMEIINKQLTAIIGDFISGPVDEAVQLIIKTHGSVSVAELTEQVGVGERQLERLFHKYVGLPPKFYARVIRFSYIFHRIDEKKFTWTDLGLQVGFYDQPHFIKNFKAFTGEEPSQYFFNEPSLANFFMKKP